MKLWLWFVIGTILAWGAYVPTIHSGQLGFGEQRGPLRAFLFVGLAYFLVAVLIPSILLFYGKMEPAQFPAKGAGISTLAGVFGALGALGVILALMTGGRPDTVPPLVFAGAPIMAVLVSMVLHRPQSIPDWRFFAGIIMTGVGAALVLRYKPA